MLRNWMRAIVARFPEISHERKRLIAEKASVAAEYEACRDDLVKVQKAYEQSRDEIMRLQDRLEDSLRDRTELWKLTRECLAGERTAYQMHINVQWQQKGGGIPYPEQPHLPPADKTLPPGGGRERQLPSEVIGERTRGFMREQLER